MKPEVLLTELEAVAETMGIKVSYEALGASVGRGGLCRVKGEYRVIIDKRAGAGERAATLASSLAGFDWQSIDIKPQVRDVIAYYAVRRAS
ncbi:MAG: hypothetical protein KJO07_23710 [Deltaproteobacteria bacterium]|jgi:hypothetical protein|nr:hypothetical protein [Deltaproteobacteria bacterium]